MDQIVYPPGMGEADFRKTPKRFREDAIQEAWVAHLERERMLRGGQRVDPNILPDPKTAASCLVKREWRFEKFHLSAPGLDRAESDGKEAALKAEDLGLHDDPFHGLCRDDT